MASLLEELAPYRDELTLLGLISAAVFVLCLALVPILVVRAPADAVRRMLSGHGSLPMSSWRWWVRNTLGLVLLSAGILMLVLPGQGVLTIAAALAIMTFPGRRAVLAWILRRPAVIRGANRLRHYAGKQPFAAEEPSQPPPE